MTPRGALFDGLMADLDSAVAEMVAWIHEHRQQWTRGPAGKWTAGQHAEHVARSFELLLESFDENARRLAGGTLPARPRRGPLQALFHVVFVRPGWIPRGGKTIPPAFPGEAPQPADVERRLLDAARRYRTLGAALDPASRDRLWVRNPFIPLFWQYTLPEAVRIQAVHLRHHLAQMKEM